MNSPPRLSSDSMVMRFPARLWRIVNSCTSGAISWGPNGKTVRVLRHKFEKEYLLAVSKPFKTSKFESFVRQLNHYGFKKVYAYICRLQYMCNIFITTTNDQSLHISPLQLALRCWCFLYSIILTVLYRHLCPFFYSSMHYTFFCRVPIWMWFCSI